MIIVLHKPYGVLSQFTEEPGSRFTALSIFDLPPTVYPVGRLDADSEGMLVLTDEKGLVAPLLDPEHGHQRTYLVQVEGVMNLEKAHTLERGVSIKTGITRPCTVQLLHEAPPIEERVPPIRVRASIPTSWVFMTLTEGKNRQVRRMTAAIGHPTLRLIRHAIGGLSLSRLAIGVGEWRELTDGERRLLLQRGQGPSY